jgi:small-conductance mechanosensitive channel
MIIVIVIFITFSFIISVIERYLLLRVRAKHQISNVRIFSRLLRYAFLIVIVIIAVASYAGSWTGLGVGVGLFSAALGWALQRPITGIAGWVMVIVKRPFVIGDRVIIGTVRGDVRDITLSHIHIAEIGGIAAGEENSGRIVMVPNSILFEQNIINYTYLHEETVLDQVAFTVTHESDLDKVEKIAIAAAQKVTHDSTDKEPYIRTYFTINGVDVWVRYFAPAKNLQLYSSTITREIFNQIRKTKDVNFAYQRTDFKYRDASRRRI